MPGRRYPRPSLPPRPDPRRGRGNATGAQRRPSHGRRGGLEEIAERGAHEVKLRTVRPFVLRDRAAGWTSTFERYMPTSQPNSPPFVNRPWSPPAVTSRGRRPDRAPRSFRDRSGSDYSRVASAAFLSSRRAMNFVWRRRLSPVHSRNSICATSERRSLPTKEIYREDSRGPCQPYAEFRGSPGGLVATSAASARVGVLPAHRCEASGARQLISERHRFTRGPWRRHTPTITAMTITL